MADTNFIEFRLRAGESVLAFRRKMYAHVTVKVCKECISCIGHKPAAKPESDLLRGWMSKTFSRTLAIQIKPTALAARDWSKKTIDQNGLVDKNVCI